MSVYLVLSSTCCKLFNASAGGREASKSFCPCTKCSLFFSLLGYPLIPVICQILQRHSHTSSLVSFAYLSSCFVDIWLSEVDREEYEVGRVRKDGKEMICFLLLVFIYSDRSFPRTSLGIFFYYVLCWNGTFHNVVINFMGEQIVFQAAGSERIERGEICVVV